MNTQSTFLSGVILGAGLMYMLDPDRGKRRRALLRDQMVHGAHELQEAGDRIEGKTRDLGNRARGAVAEARSHLRREEVDDSVLEARVRSEIGRVVSNPGAIQVVAERGRVTLSGPVREDEAEELLSTVSSVRGVGSVENRLDARRDPELVPGLQGTER